MFHRLELLIGEDKVKILKEKTVIVFGLGGVGGHAVETLARSGIGHLILVDYDKIDITNINRQIISLNSNVKEFKTEAFKKRLLDINPNIKVDIFNTYYNFDCKDLPFVGKVDFVVDAIDAIMSKKVIMKECINRKIPFVSCMGMGNKLDPSKIVITELSKTNYDPIAKVFRRWTRDEGIGDKIMVCASDEKPVKTHTSIIGSCAFVPSIAGIMMAGYVIKSLISEKENKNE